LNILLVNSSPALRGKMVNTGRCQIRQGAGLGAWPPTDLAQLASVLRPLARRIELVDFFLKSRSEQEGSDYLARHLPDIIFVHSSTPTIQSEVSFYRRLKKRLTSVRIVFFGLHVTARPEDVLDGAIEYVIRGEPEYTARELVRFFGDGRMSLNQIEGLSYYREGKIFHNPARPFIDNLDALPFPDRTLFTNNLYCLPHNREPFSIVQVSRGCPFKCTFCTAGLYYGYKDRRRSPANILAEVEEVTGKYGIRNYLFLSDTFNLHNDFVRALSEEIIKRRLTISWVCNSRLDLVSRETMLLMKEAGCWMISLGIESASAQVLKLAGKTFSMQQAEDAIAGAQSAGLKTFCYFVFGLPGETPETIKSTLRFIRRCRSDYAYFYTATPFPGTDFFVEAQSNGWLTSYDWSRYSHGESDVISYPHLPAAQIKKAVKKAYRVFYLNPERIIREISLLRSAKQFKQALKIGAGLLGDKILKRR
jgi:radical SAM superfamily enzyme YgiQ (UPF0313 family)